ncbi:YceI family protein [Nocardioides jejuensis]|jgi:polyisoprenoid-binding protein YceI|uniref:Polyisoprenoid-binding protein n=1 Tax=Nocardioides jejuensis TaxID=2502782 RepID=A0A4R1CD09_9ACTN|nr:YceI family protein [Nocardioides jejuensis]TCJ28621.1 polyisoprenoid-binding protein [Nocardioides jejuensis]
MSTTTVPASLAELTGSWTLDTTHSRVGFVARHAMVTKVRGSFNDFAGTAVIDGGIDTARIDVTIQVASVDTRNADRDGHLKTGDFFEIEKYPTITFASTSAVATGNVLEVTGDLTIKDVTKSVTVPFEFEGVAQDPYGNLRAGFEGSTVITRSDFGITFNAALETGGVLVSDKITLEFEVSAVKSA